MKRALQLLFLVLLTACSAHQPFRLDPNRVLFNSAEINQPVASATHTDSIKWIRPIPFSRGAIKVRYLDGHDVRIAKNTFWGYTDRKGKVYRHYRKTFLEVVHVGELVKYEVQTHTTYGTVTHTYYSKNLDSQTFSSPKKALRDTGTAY